MRSTLGYISICLCVCMCIFTQYGQHHLLLLIRSKEKATKDLVYDKCSLKQLRSKVVQTHELRVIPSGTVWRIRQLKLNRKWKRGRWWGVVREWLPGNGVNKNNLIWVSTLDFENSWNLNSGNNVDIFIIGLLNIRPIKRRIKQY